MSLLKKDLDLKFPYGEHEDCRALTTLTLASMPKDGSLGRTHRYQRNAEVWQPGDRSNSLFFVERGRVVIYSVDREGHELVLRTVVSGEPFGEMCFCDGPTRVRHTTARAVASSSVIEVKIEHFINFMQSDAEILGQVIFTFCTRLADAERRVEILALRSAEERLGNSLLHLTRTRGVALNPQKPLLKKLDVTHDELARLTALSRQRVTITMNRFRELGFLTYNRNQPLLVEVAALADFLGADAF